MWTGVRRVSDVVPNCAHTVFHAGPPFASVDEIPVPVRNSICVAAIFEGWADEFASAVRLLERGVVRPAAAQDHGVLVPLAGVLSPNMAVLEIRDGEGRIPVRIHAAINEGPRHATRLGRLDPELPAHLRWLNGPFACWLAERTQRRPIELAPLIEQALREGDDGHARTVAGSRLLGDVLQRRAPLGTETNAANEFIAESPAFALNAWMAAAALWLRAAEGIASCTWISRVGGNGHRFGIQLAGWPERWMTTPAPIPAGIRDDAHAARAACGALGDSAVVDFVGLGAQALEHAPSLRDSLNAVLPADIAERPKRVLAARGSTGPVAIGIADAAACASAHRGPVVLIGMIDAAGDAGRIGGGVVDVPAALFDDALRACEPLALW
jgi:hypothetical protein